MTKKTMRVAGLTTLALAASLIAMPTTASAEPAPAQGTALTGKTIFLDPGHQGSSAGQDLNKPVPDGRGGTKACQTTGATSPGGVAEHKVNWDITQLVKAGLESQGAKVVLSRQDDTGWGGCIDERINAANASNADIAVNVHADSTSVGTDETKSGFHIIVPQLPVPDATVQQVQSGPGRNAAGLMRDAFKDAGLVPANYAGAQDGVQARSDVAAANLTKVPNVFVELGNLSNTADAAALTGPDGQLKYAVGLIDGMLRFLLTGDSPAAPATSSSTAAPAPAAPTSAAPTTTTPQAVAPQSTTASPAPTTPAPGASTAKTTTPTTSAKPTTPTRKVDPGLGLPSLPLGSENGTSSPSSPPAPESGTATEGIDLSGLQSLLPLVSSLLEADDSEGIAGLLATQGNDAASQVLEAMLSVLYEIFGGKLPV
ncbi:N-acetylmuramoyl-L-alanine amidase [Williamsia sp.]|uniref:N-acetylmuramoyl-L-alanine amidase family protein n=1 Tax=Williamsia sp. TaxID=1872085 RepID=UPI002F929359